jgi:putative tricarboxylic transport membrane protein
MATSRDLKVWSNAGLVGGDVNAGGPIEDGPIEDGQSGAGAGEDGAGGGDIIPQVARRFDYQEAPYAFRFDDAWWLLTDTHEGLAASESANNAMCGGAIIPLLTLGIPGDAVTAIIFGVFLIHGLVPGPGLLTQHTATIAPMFAALFVASAFVMISVIAFGPFYLRLARINRGVLYGFIGLISMAGVYASSFSGFQMWMALAIGIFAFALRRFGYPAVPMLMGVILGPYLEKFLRGSMIVSQGDPLIFVTSPFSLMFLVMTAVFIWLLRLRPGVRP